DGGGGARGAADMSAGAHARLHACALALLLAACASEEEIGAEPDPHLVGALVALHLSNARAQATGEPADSLRAAAYAHVRRTTGLDSAAVARRLSEAARRPEDAHALFGRVTDSLAALRP